MPVKIMVQVNPQSMISDFQTISHLGSNNQQQQLSQIPINGYDVH